MMFWKQVRAAHRIRDLVNLFGEKILLINYKDDNIFKVYNKKFRQTLTQAEWNEFLTRLKEGKGEVNDIFNEGDKSISEFFSRNNEQMKCPESGSSSTSESSDKRYTDIDINDPLHLAEKSLENVIVLDSRHGACFPWERKVTGHPKINMVIAPRHRENHWVCYAAKKIGDEWCWYFADSLESIFDGQEIRTVADHMGLEIPKTITISRGVPKQQDQVSCGAYVVEWALRFITNNRAVWESPDELRKKHKDFITGMRSGEDQVLKTFYPSTDTTESCDGESFEVTIPEEEESSNMSESDSERAIIEERREDEKGKTPEISSTSPQKQPGSPSESTEQKRIRSSPKFSDNGLSTYNRKEDIPPEKTTNKYCPKGL
ncbi:hypothetical protein HK098_005206, partial [Nowakowskiella sp. JEL0407]